MFYTFNFIAEANFTTTVELSKYQLEKIKKLIGNKKILLSGNNKDNGLIEFLTKECEFDTLELPTDLENIKVELADNLNNKPLPLYKKAYPNQDLYQDWVMNEEKGKWELSGKWVEKTK